MTLRPARVDDVPAIRALIKGLAEYERLGEQAAATTEQLEATLFGPRPFAEVVLAEDEDPGAKGDVGPGVSQPAVVGFALFFHNYSTFRGRPGLYLEDLYVVPERRGQGIGRALLLHLKSIAIARGCGRMEWSVLGWNEPAIGFYVKLGAEIMEDWRLCRISLP
jgi:GNAT superfamily N-acetyltransferase